MDEASALWRLHQFEEDPAFFAQSVVQVHPGGGLDGVYGAQGSNLTAGFLLPKRARRVEGGGIIGG
jgi:hypothetical protein